MSESTLTVGVIVSGESPIDLTATIDEITGAFGALVVLATLPDGRTLMVHLAGKSADGLTFMELLRRGPIEEVAGD